MTKNHKTAAQKITAVLTRRKSGITATEIAQKTGLKTTTVQSALRDLIATGYVVRIGVHYTGRVGRPPVLYAYSG